MPKLAIVLRGGLRAPAQYVLDRIDEIKENLPADVTVETFLITWKEERFKNRLKTLMESDKIDNIIALKDVDVNYIKNILITGRYLNHGQEHVNPAATENSFRMFWHMKTISELIDGHFNKFDLVYMSRLDAKMKITDWSDWLDKDYYVMPDVQKLGSIGHEKEWFWDQSGCATPANMKAVWDYKNFDILNQAYGWAGNTPYQHYHPRKTYGTGLHFRGWTPEAAVCNFMELNGCTVKLKGSECFEGWAMYDRRHEYVEDSDML